MATIKRSVIVRHVAITAAFVFVAEILTMLLFRLFTPVSPLIEYAANAVLVTSIAFPMWYGLLYKPLARRFREIEQKELRVRESEQTVSAIVTTAVDGIVTIDESGVVLSFNPAASEIFGYSPEDIIGESVCRLIPDPQHIEIKVRESEETVSAIVTNAADGLVTIDESGVVHSFNPAASEILGCSPDDIIGEKVSRLIPEPLRTEPDISVARYLRRGDKRGIGRVNIQVRGMRENGRAFPMELAVSEIHVGAKRIFTGIVHDVTRRQNMEEELLAYRSDLERLIVARTSELAEARLSAESADRAKSRFVAVVSHEIRVPLNAIIGYAEFIAEAKTLETAHELAETLLSVSDTLHTLVDNVLDHAKIESGKLELDNRLLDPRQLLATITNSHRLQAEAKGLKLTLDIEEDVPAQLLGDELRISQIVNNLLSNAIKFTEHGSVMMRVEALKSYGGFATLRFLVMDTGVGIEEKQRQTIFDSFTQADRSTSRDYGGTGLGTAIARRLVELMGGEIGVESEPGEGSTFWFVLSLPIGKDEEKHGAAGDEVELSLPENIVAGRILLAEDYLPNQLVARKHLEDAGHTVVAVDNGRQAVKVCQTETFDLILMDLQMPLMDGNTAARTIRESGPCSEVPIVALTAHADIRTRDLCLSAGMNDVITKPIRRVSFLTIINSWLTAPQSGEVDAQPAAPQARDATFDEQRIPFDYDEAVREFGGDKEAVDEVLARFLDESEEQLRLLWDALEQGDTETLRREAHKIKGGAANLTALPLSAAAGQLERLAVENKLEDESRALQAFEAELVRLKNFLED